jgi:hypothetical protein
MATRDWKSIVVGFGILFGGSKVILEGKVSARNSWIDDVLKNFHLREDGIDDSREDRYRLMIARSPLLERMNAICNAINLQAGQGIIYAEAFVQPHPMFCRYIFDKEGIEFSMALVIQFEGPTVILSSTKSNLWVRSIERYRWSGIFNRSNVACKLVIDPATVSDADLQQWFTYLLSGLQHSHKPDRRMPLNKRSGNLLAVFFSLVDSWASETMIRMTSG